MKRMTLEQPEISIVATAARPSNWMELYKSIGNNDVSLEFVFVGPNEPNFQLPKNFRFIKSNVKPAQCLEIAIREAKGKLFLITADDCFFTTEKPLDHLYLTYQSFNDDKLIISPRFMREGKDLSSIQSFWGDGRESPLLPVGGLMSKKTFMEMGGIDRNFIAVMYDVDVAMRIWAAGGQVVLSEVCIEEDKSKSNGSTLCNDYWKYDRQLLLDLWTRDNQIMKNRTAPVQSFSEVRLQTKSQGPQGRWKYNLSFLNKVMTHPLYNRMKNIVNRINNIKSFSQLVSALYRRMKAKA